MEKSKKGKLALKILLGVLAAVILALGIPAVVFVSTTVSAANLETYCSRLSHRAATEFGFEGTGTGDGGLYMFVVSANGDDSKPQELFLFKRGELFGFEFNRYKFITSTVEATLGQGAAPVGTFKFYPKNSKGEPSTTATLVVFGAGNESKIASYTYKLTTLENLSTDVDQTISFSGSSHTFIDVYKGISLFDSDKKTMTNFRFYDDKGKLIYTLKDS